MVKKIEDIRNEFFDNGKLSIESMKDLIWHIENDQLPERAISLVTDAHLMKLVPLVAKHLEHEDDFVRQLTVGCLVGRLGLSEYAEIAFNMARTDPDSGPRSLATSSLGAVINKVNPFLKEQIADYLYNVITKPEYEDSHKKCAFDSILEAMGIPIPQLLTMSYDQNYDFVEQFKIKYSV
jgi:hypothetical protein